MIVKTHSDNVRTYYDFVYFANMSIHLHMRMFWEIQTDYI